MADANDIPTLVDKLYEYSQTRADEPALQDISHTLTWRELDALTNRIANALRAAGLQRGNRVAILADTNVQTASILLGVLKAAGSVVPVPTLISTEAIARVLEDCDARALFVSAECRRLLTNDGQDLACVRVAMDYDGDGWISLEAFLGLAGTARPDIHIQLTDEFNIIYSSGTTGRPKGIVHDHALRAELSVELEPISFPLGVRTVTTTALNSNWTMGALVYTLWAGGCVHFLGKFSPQALIDVCRAWAPGNVFLVPVQISRLLADRSSVAAMESLAPAMKWTAGSFLAAKSKQALLTGWPGGLVEIYGMTEGTPFTILKAHERPDKCHTVGRSDPPEDLKIIDEHDHELPVGQRGEVVGRVRKVMTGYNNNDAATQTLFWHDADGVAYFRSGDIGVLDEEGFLQVTDRKKDMIISGGFNIYASDLEEVLLCHPSISEAAVFGLANAKWGETPGAVVVLRPGATVTSQELRTWANERLGKLQRLAFVEVTDKLPRGSLDKILKRELREAYSHLIDPTKD